jgi:hypothetical protein
MNRHRAATLVALTLAGIAAPAAAGPFRNGDLFTGAAVKQGPDDRRFAFGANFQIAPIKAIIKSQVKKQLDAYAKDNPESAALQEHLQSVDTAELRALAKDGKLDEFKAKFRAELEANGGKLSPEQEAFLQGLDAKKLNMFADLIEIAQEPEQAMTFGLEPWAAVNFKYAQLRASVALAGVQTDAGTSLQLGNLGLDASTGAHHGSGGVVFGWTLGVRGWAPTATEDANVLALANVLATPRFLHEYATVSPYLTLGLDFTLLQWTVRAEYVHMLAVRQGDVKVDDMAYLQAGTGLLLLLRWVGLSVELDGVFDLQNAGAMGNTVLLSAGARGYLGPVGLGAGIQTPLVRPDDSEARLAVGGVATGSLAAINFLVQARMQF